MARLRTTPDDRGPPLLACLLSAPLLVGCEGREPGPPDSGLDTPPPFDERLGGDLSDAGAVLDALEDMQLVIEYRHWNWSGTPSATE